MIKMQLSKYRDFLRGKSVAYNHVFNRQNVFTDEVLADLAKFCRAHESSFHADPRMHAVLEGRREVWLKIQNYLNLSPDELIELYKIRDIQQGD